MTDHLGKLLRQEEQLRRDREIRQKVFDHYGQVCVCCGAVKGLTIDHINGDGKAHRREMKDEGFYSWLIRHRFPPGYQVLCMSCNASKGIGPACKMHDDIRGLKKLWLLMSREERIAFLDWVPELDPEQEGNIWSQPRSPDARPLPQPRKGWFSRRFIKEGQPELSLTEPVQVEARNAAQAHRQREKTTPRRRMREILHQAGPDGLMVGTIVKMLAHEAQATGNPELRVHRNTVHEWLRADEEKGFVQRSSHNMNSPYGRWRWIRQVADGDLVYEEDESGNWP